MNVILKRIVLYRPRARE